MSQLVELPVIHGFTPIADSRATILILGSMPGQASLDAAQYYAHPRNAFWPIMTRILGLSTSLDYQACTQGLKKAGIALWDVLQSCRRRGSLDSDIRQTQANDFITFFKTHSRIEKILFNGAAAHKLFARHISVADFMGKIDFQTMPSTSPANARLSFEDKLTYWASALNG